MHNTNPKSTPHEFQFFWACLSATMLFFSSTALGLAAGGDLQRYAAHGTLTAIESMNSVVIDNKGFLVDHAVLVENALGRPIPLLKLLPPVPVEFEYCYMARAPKSMTPVIVSIRVAPEIAKKKRVSR